MTTREKKAVTLAAGAVVLFALLHFVLLPLWEEGRRLRRNIVTQEGQLAEMRQLLSEGTAAGRPDPAAQTALHRRPRDFTLFSFLEQAAASAGVKEHIEAMQPVQSEQEEGAPARGTTTVELQLRDIGLAQLARFLEQVESPGNLVAVERLAIQGGGRDGAPLSASLRVQAMATPADERQ